MNWLLLRPQHRATRSRRRPLPTVRLLVSFLDSPLSPPRLPPHRPRPWTVKDWNGLWLQKRSTSHAPFPRHPHHESVKRPIKPQASAVYDILPAPAKGARKSEAWSVASKERFKCPPPPFVVVVVVAAACFCFVFFVLFLLSFFC